MGSRSPVGRSPNFGGSGTVQYNVYRENEYSVSHAACKNGVTDRAAVWAGNGPKESC